MSMVSDAVECRKRGIPKKSIEVLALSEWYVSIKEKKLYTYMVIVFQLSVRKYDLILFYNTVMRIYNHFSESTEQFLEVIQM